MQIEDNTQNNVIRFKPRAADAPRDEAEPLVKKKPRDYEGCKHNYTEVDDVLRTVECADCHVELDPIEVLLGLCRTYTERDYKFQKIQEFEEKEAIRLQKERARREAKKAW